MFDNLVCPLFEIYKDMQGTLQVLSENDVTHHSVSVLNFVTERQIEALCRRVSIYIFSINQCLYTILFIYYTHSLG